jgi:tRNA(fMet)-specific endonuclease VapC
MAIILDADVIIRGEKEKFDLQGWFAANANETFQVAAVTVAELWHGVERAAGVQRYHREQYLRSIIGPLAIISYTEETAYEHARIWAQLEATGKMVGYYDLIVAATALQHGCGVATFNKKHFSLVPGLRIIEPTAPDDQHH